MSTLTPTLCPTCSGSGATIVPATEIQHVRVETCTTCKGGCVLMRKVRPRTEADR